MTGVLFYVYHDHHLQVYHGDHYYDGVARDL